MSAMGQKRTFCKDELCRLKLPEYEARSHRRVDHLIAEGLSCEIVEAITRAVSCDQIIRIDASEFLDGFADVVVAKRGNDMKSADHGKHFIYSGCGDRLAHGVNHAAMTARCQHDKAPVLDQKCGAYLMLEIVSDVVAGILGRRHFLWKAAEAIENSDNLCTRLEWLLKRDLTDAAGREGVVCDQRRLGRHHQ